MSRTDEIYKRALAKTKIPLLVLDNNWHKLFTQTDETPEIRKLEKKLNELLKEQGKSNTEQKKLKACKRKLMDEIIQLADRYGGSMDEAIEREMDRHRRLVEECNGRLEQLQENTDDNEEEIEETNYQLMLKTMELCYKRLEENRKEIEYYEDWIKKAREELKENIVRKQEREESTFELYTYMHNIFGRDVIDIFDMHYHPENYRRKKKEDGYIE
ncbi:MAG: hypothetical protein HFI11_13570 [Lachnospiraceae bacterium]|jgi:uncharacterized protein YukE|nr:hypothetical protein [Lachnospiraceae bacterium]